MKIGDFGLGDQICLALNKFDLTPPRIGLRIAKKFGKS